MNKYEKKVTQTQAKREFKYGGRYKNAYTDKDFNRAYGEAYIQEMEKAGKL
tara:strand:- start:120 stop:272 length:153 start_codon:yes stop_codon:yes gene_type:complete